MDAARPPGAGNDQDVRMPDLDGIAATRRLAREAPAARVLILTTFEQDDYVFGALRAGASGFLLKRARPEELIAAVHTIAAGEALLSPSVTRRVIDRMAQQPTPDLAGRARLEALTRASGRCWSASRGACPTARSPPRWPSRSPRSGHQIQWFLLDGDDAVGVEHEIPGLPRALTCGEEQHPVHPDGQDRHHMGPPVGAHRRKPVGRRGRLHDLARRFPLPAVEPPPSIGCADTGSPVNARHLHSSAWIARSQLRSTFGLVVRAHDASYRRAFSNHTSHLVQ
jgi:Response regulator receiver domain